MWWKLDVELESLNEVPILVLIELYIIVLTHFLKNILSQLLTFVDVQVNLAKHRIQFVMRVQHTIVTGAVLIPA